jgi:hypothetical protein
MKKKTLALTTALALSLSLGTTAFAAPVATGDGGVFDADYYADNNSDVEAAYGHDFNLLWKHFITFGYNEGRLPFAVGTDWQAILAASNTSTTVNTETTQQTQTTQTEETQTQETQTQETQTQETQTQETSVEQGQTLYYYCLGDDFSSPDYREFMKHYGIHIEPGVTPPGYNTEYR